MIDSDLASARGLRAPGTSWMVAGSLVGALGAFAFQLVGGRALGTVGFAPIAALWTAFFILATVVLVPLEQFATREASRGLDVVRRHLSTLVAVTAAGMLVGVGFVVLTLERFFEGDPTYIVQMALLMLGYGVVFAGRGVLAGHRRFRAFGLLLAAESLLRLVVLGALLAVGGRAVTAAWSMVAAPLAILLVPFWQRTPDAEARRERSVRFLGAYASGSVASQILLAASPLAVSFLGGSAALFSVVFMTFTLFRAPMTLIYSLQGRLLSMLVRLVEAGERSRIRGWSATVAGAGLALTALAWVVGRVAGPEVVVFLSRPEFEPTVAVAGLVAAGMVAASAAQITGQLLVAEGKTGKLALAWAVGLVVAGGMLAVRPGGPDLSVAQAFFLGELTALAVVGFTVIRSHRRPKRHEARPSPAGARPGAPG